MRLEDLHKTKHAAEQFVKYLNLTYAPDHLVLKLSTGPKYATVWYVWPASGRRHSLFTMIRMSDGKLFRPLSGRWAALKDPVDYGTVFSPEWTKIGSEGVGKYGAS